MHTQYCNREQFVILEAPASAILGRAGTLAGVSWGTRLEYSTRYAALGQAHSAVLPQNASNLPGTNSAPFVALSLHPSSTLRALNVYFDRSVVPVPLVGGQIIRRRFESVRLDTLRETARLVPSVANNPANGLVCPQFARLCAWIVDPEIDRLELAGAISVAINPSSFPDAAQVPALYLIHPGAHRLRLWCTNENTVNAGAIAIATYRAHSQHGESLSAPLASTGWRRENTAVAAIAVPAAADAFVLDPVEIGTPGPETISFATPAVGGANTATLGAEIVFEPGW